MILARALENVLLFTEIPTEKMLQRQIYVQNIQYDVLLRKGGGLRSCAISIMGSEHQSCYPLGIDRRGLYRSALLLIMDNGG